MLCSPTDLQIDPLQSPWELLVIRLVPTGFSDVDVFRFRDVGDVETFALRRSPRGGASVSHRDGGPMWSTEEGKPW